MATDLAKTSSRLYDMMQICNGELLRWKTVIDNTFIDTLRLVALNTFILVLTARCTPIESNAGTYVCSSCTMFGGFEVSSI